MNTINKTILIISVIFLTGCATSKVNVSVSNYSTPIESIALLPAGGVAADAIGIELLQYGFNVYDTETTSSIMIRLNLTEVEFSDPLNLKELSKTGIDAILKVKTVVGYDNRPNSIITKLVETKTGKLIIGANFQNGKGGAMGSPADGMMRSDISSACKKIASEIAVGLNKN
jgi:hypothetical protein